MNDNDDYLLGKIVKVENKYVYLQTYDFNNANKSYLIFKNKIYKTPYVGLLVKVNSFGNIYVAKIESEKLFINENNKYKIYKCLLMGSKNKEYIINPNLAFTPQIGNSVYLFSNDELDKFESTQKSSSHFIENVGTIVESGKSLSLSIDLFSSNVLIAGTNNSGKEQFSYNLYYLLFKNYLNKFKRNQKFIFIDLNNNFDKNFNLLPFFDKNNFYQNGKKISISKKNKNLNLFSKNNVLLEDYYLLGQANTINEKKIANDFYEWELNDFKLPYLEKLMLNLNENEKVLKILQKIFEILYLNCREKVKNNVEFTKKEKYINYSILNIYTLLNHIQIKENKLYIQTILFQENKEFKKAFWNIFKHFKDEQFVELTYEKYNWLRNFVFLKQESLSFSLFDEIEKQISNNSFLKSNIFVAFTLLKSNQYTHEEVLFFLNKFLKNWNNISFLFYDPSTKNEISLNEFDKNNVFIFNLNDLFFEEKTIASTIIIKKSFEYFKNLNEQNKILNISINSAESLFNLQNSQDDYYQKYINTFYEKLLEQGKREKVFTTFTVNSLDKLSNETINLFNNFFIFNLYSSNELELLMNNFNVFNNEMLINIREFKYGDFYCFGKNFIRLLLIRANINENLIQKENSYEVTMSKLISEINI